MLLQDNLTKRYYFSSTLIKSNGISKGGLIMPKLILVGGGSASGKTYVTQAVINNLDSSRITHLSLDDYYKDQSNLTMEERMKVNYDHPKAFDWKLMEAQLSDLKAGKPIQKPIYDFTQHNRSGNFETIYPKDLVVCEGIMALVNKRIRDLSDLKVFVNASRERRLLRRIDRDQKERGRSFDSIVNQFFSTVRPMFEEVVGPSENYADLIINNDDEQKNLSIKVVTAIFQTLLDEVDRGQ